MSTSQVLLVMLGACLGGAAGVLITRLLDHDLARQVDDDER